MRPTPSALVPRRRIIPQERTTMAFAPDVG
ncbi:Protein of unknown function [Pyronema omphalodes CBS 100304]|uniref:Uncharacterized protein n=1 Tax=Pyronema omphalodes (strain CBS 100304) TaxID=1076935 RepID=U4L0J4_PYROM|nr:Protein of unknown function [Pyronema omphalodes CBS 100304]